MQEVAFRTEAEIVDWPPEALTVEGEAASPVMNGGGVFAQADGTGREPRCAEQNEPQNG